MFCALILYSHLVNSPFIVHASLDLVTAFGLPNGIVPLTLSNGSRVEVYCDMKGNQCDGEGGWTRVAFVNMSKPGSSCPPGLVQYDDTQLMLD